MHRIYLYFTLIVFVCLAAGAALFTLDRTANAASATVCDFCNLQFPSSFSVNSGATTTEIYGQIFETGVTAAAGPSANVTAQVGYGANGSDPRVAAWTWFAAGYNVQSGNNDEYMGKFAAPAPGTYKYTFRFSLDGGTTWTYADLDGNGENAGLSFSTAMLGTMTVNAGPPVVTTSPATNITAATATLNGSANPAGASATGYFRYGTSNPGSCSDAFGTRAPTTGGLTLGSGAAQVAFSRAIVSLAPSTTYYYCAAATNANGTTFGSVQSFTTLASTSWSVDSTVDEQDFSCSDGDCSLRDAIRSANPGDIITFTSLFDSPQTITLGIGEIAITKDLTIAGPGANLLTVNAGAGTNRIFNINAPGSAVTISGMRLTGAHTTGLGGAIFSVDTVLTLDRMYIVGNSATTAAAAYLNGGTNTIRNSTIASNTASNCGAISMRGTGNILLIQNSTLSANSTQNVNTAGAICNLSSQSTLTIRNATITQNTSTVSAGGIFANAGTLDLGSSIIAGNTAPAQPEIGLAGATVVSSGFNLIGDSAGDATDTGTAITWKSTDILDTPPALGGLQDNGGGVPTHSVAKGSPAIDKGNAFGMTLDQRAAPRTIDFGIVAEPVGGDGTDIGAFEALIPTAAPVSLSGRIRTSSGTGVSNTIVTISGGTLGQPMFTRTNTFGYFTFTGLDAGATYFVSIQPKKYTIANPTRVVSLLDNLAGFDFIVEYSARR